MCSFISLCRLALCAREIKLMSNHRAGILSSKNTAIHLLLNSLKVHILVLLLAVHLVPGAFLPGQFSLHLLLLLAIVDVLATKAWLGFVGESSLHVGLNGCMLRDVTIETDLFAVTHGHVLVVAASLRSDHS